MLDYNTAALRQYQNLENQQETAVATWEASHGTILPRALDMEQAEEYLATAAEYDVDLSRPWYYQSNPFSRLDGAFNQEDTYAYLEHWLKVHGYQALIREVSGDIQPKTDYLEFFFTKNHLTPLEFLIDSGFRLWE